MSDDFARFAATHLSDTHLNVPTEYPPADLGRVTFRDGPGGDMPHLWAEHMLRFWFEASRNNKRPSFSEALQNTVAHFMMGNQEP